MLSIRRASEADCALIRRLAGEVFPATYREILAFMDGEDEIDRDPRALPRRAWPTRHRLAYDVLTMLAATVMGGVIGYAAWSLLH